MLDASAYLLCSKLCRHNLHRPTTTLQLNGHMIIDGFNGYTGCSHMQGCRKVMKSGGATFIISYSLGGSGGMPPVFSCSETAFGAI